MATVNPLEQLARQISDLQRRMIHRRLGTVIATSPLTVDVGGTVYEDVRRLDTGWSPAIGDPVKVDFLSGEILVLGKVM